MARFQRFRNAYSNRGAYYSRGKTYAKNWYKSNNMNNFLMGAGGAVVLPIAGVQNSMLDLAALLVATAPIKGLGKFKGIAQGYIFTKGIMGAANINPATLIRGGAGTTSGEVV